MKVLRIKNLPNPTEEMIKSIKEDILENQQCKHFEGFNLKFDNLFRNRPERVGMGFPIKQPKNLMKLGKDIFQDYFSVPIDLSITYFQSRSGDNSYSIPAHSHKNRTLAINFYLELGYDQAKTYFYDRINKLNGDPIEKWANFYFKEDLEPYGYFIANSQTWYSFPTWIPHSIENISSTRILLTIETPPLYDMVDLVHESKLEFEQVPLTMA